MAGEGPRLQEAGEVQIPCQYRQRGQTQALPHPGAEEAQVGPAPHAVMPSARSARGFTLFEVVVAGGILSLLLLIVAQLTTTAYRTSTRTTEVVTNYRLAANTLHAMANEIRGCQDFFWPSLSSARIGAVLAVTRDRPLRFSFKGEASGGQAVAAVYTFDASSGEIRKKLCDLSSFVASDPTTWDPIDGGDVDGRVVAKGINAFSLSLVSRSAAVQHVRLDIGLKAAASVYEASRADLPSIPLSLEVAVVSR